MSRASIFAVLAAFFAVSARPSAASTCGFYVSTISSSHHHAHSMHGLSSPVDGNDAARRSEQLGSAAVPGEGVPRCRGPHCSQAPQLPAPPPPTIEYDGSRQPGSLLSALELERSRFLIGWTRLDQPLASQAERDAVFRPPCIAG